MHDVPFRRSAGRQDEDGIRVDVTRHCLAHGRVRLPYALRDRVPEGVLSAHDPVADTDLALEVRGGELTGLGALFERHALAPNDAIVVRIDAAGTVQVVPAPSARAGAGGDDRPVDPTDPTRERHLAAAPTTTPEPAPTAPAEVGETVTIGETTIRAVRRTAEAGSAGPTPSAPTPSAAGDRSARAERAAGGPVPPRAAPPSAAPPAAPSAATPDRRAGDPTFGAPGRVVDRFGSVTVRRLGKQHVPTSEPATMPPDTVPEPVPEPVPDAPQDGGSGAPPEADRFDATLVVRDVPPPAATPTTPPRDDAMLADPAPTPDDEGEAADAPAPVQPGLFAAGPARSDTARPRTPRAPRPSTRTVRDPSRGAPPPVTVDDLADPRDVGPQASAAGGAVATAPAQAAPAPTRAPDPAPPAAAVQDGTSTLDAAVLERVERWLRDPRTPVLVRLDRLRDGCDLDDATTRQVADALVATPPDGLVLEPIAPGYLRVARRRPSR